MNLLIELTEQPNKFDLKICQPFLQVLIGMMNTRKLKAFLRHVFGKLFISYFLLMHILFLLIDVSCACGRNKI